MGIANRLSFYRLKFKQFESFFESKRRITAALKSDKKKICLLMESCGLGDILMLSPLAEELSKKSCVVLACPEGLIDAGLRIPGFAAVAGLKKFEELRTNFNSILRPTYRTVYENRKADRHVTACLSESIGLNNVSPQVHYTLTKNEETYGRRMQAQYGRYIVLAPECLSFREKKEWPSENWQKVIDAMELPVIVAGGWPHSKLTNCVDLRFRTTIHEAAAIIKNATLFMGVVSGPFWFTNAFHVPAVIVQGGFEPPVFTQHPLSYYVTSKETPCLSGNEPCCEGECMRLVQPERVIELVRDVVHKYAPDTSGERGFKTS